MGTLGMYPVSRTGWKLNDDDVLAECHACGRQKMMTREFIDAIACVPQCRCGGRVWMWIRGGLHQYESQAPRIVFRCEGRK